MPPTVIKDPKLSLKGHAYWCRDVTWSPDGELLATASADNHVRVFQSDGTEAFKCAPPPPARAALPARTSLLMPALRRP